jgi:putative hemolysin
MVHRRYVRALPIDADVETVRKVFLEAGHRRLPIYEGSIDNIVGYLSWRDVVERVWGGRPVVLRELLRDVNMVPVSAPAAPLLREMLRTRRHLVIVVDEHGGMAGIVTLEDLLEELVGEIDSEHGKPRERVERRPDGSAQVVGELALREVDRELGTALEEEAEADTVGGLLVQLAGDRIPRSGETFEATDGTRLEVLDASPRRVRRVAVVPGGSRADEDGGGE